MSLDVAEGEFVTIVGPSGAGKTTLMQATSGSARGTAGRLELPGRDMAPLASRQRAAPGIARVPEGRRVFPSLTVLEDLEPGRVVLEGAHDALLADPRVQRAYLGV